jgi:uncharacterized protein (DUF433 family)
MGGMPCIRGLRIPVATVVGMIADGMTENEILSAYPDLESDDVHEALRYVDMQLRRYGSVHFRPLPREIHLCTSGC